MVNNNRILVHLVACHGLLFSLVLLSMSSHAQVGTELDTVSTNYGRYLSLLLAEGVSDTPLDSPLVAYENSSAGLQGLAVSRCFDPLCRQTASTTLDGRGSSNAAGVFSRILRGQDGHALIVHLRIGVGGALRVVRCGLRDCTGGMGPANEINSIALAQGTASIMDAAIGSDGFPVIAARLRDGATELGLWVIKCSDPVCELSTTQTQIDPSRPLAGGVIDLTIGDDGFPQIAFQDRDQLGVNGHVALLSCNDLACAGQDETLHLLDELGGGVGRIIDLKIASSGHPVIAYAGLGSTLQVIACNDAVCSGDDDLPSIILTQDPVSQAVAMDLDSQDRPAIAAHSQSADSLEIIFCNDPACAGDDERSVDVFQSENEDIASGAWVDAVFDPSDRLQIVYQVVERVASGPLLGSVYAIHCEFEGCGPVFADGFEASP